MSFRKRNVGLSGSANSEFPSNPSKPQIQQSGIRPSPIDGRSTTSTGTASLDALLAGHAGLVLGCSILIEENGTTDYAGALLKFYAAEGLLQSHHVHVIGMPEHWGRELPGVLGETDKKETTSAATEKMKIAWRYESLGQFGANASSRERSLPVVNSGTGNQASGAPTVICHTFDLTKRLIHPASSILNFLQLGVNPALSPFASVPERLRALVSSSSPDTVHRIVVPSLLSPALYPPWSSQPQHILQFLHGLRALFSTFPDRLTAMMSLPLSLHPRSSGLVRWIELLNDGVLELAPFPHSAEGDISAPRSNSGTTEEPPQGLLQVHRLPMLHERGSGNGTSENDWTFTLSRRKFTIKPFNLPPVEGDTDAQQAAGPEKKATKADVEF